MSEVVQFREEDEKIAHLRRLGFYDAAYLEAAARSPGSVLVTSDRALLEAAGRSLGAGRALTPGDAAP